ncbi:hypothetical protein AB0H00_23085 [Nocardia sp. NPDC023852]|uniref:hypothetical protein n=1 Tax=Nocardia sp. NPDC023852 TaxID=3154697 RepID=UPI0033CFF28B
MDGPTLKEILDFDESEYPIESAENPIHPLNLTTLAKFTDEPIQIEESHLYFIGLHSD